MHLLLLPPAAIAAVSLLLASCGPETDPDGDSGPAASDASELNLDTPSDLGPDERDASDVEPEVAPDAQTDQDSASDSSGDLDAEPDTFPADPLQWEMREAGPFHVGYRRYEVTYQRPDGPLERTISVSVWYPTEDSSGSSPMYLDVFPDPVPFENATPATPVHSGGYPVHVHSHGYQGYSGTSAFLMRHYASHGWIVVAPDHIGNTLLDHRDPLENAHYFLKSLDIRESLDLLEDLPNDDPLAGLAQVDRVLMSGHSFGTYACWSVGGATYDETIVRTECEDLSSGPCTPEELEIFLSGELFDERVVAIVPMAGTYRASWFGETGHDSVEIPVLAMTGSADNPESSAAQWERLGGEADMLWVDIDGGCHQTFALGGCATLPMLEGFEIVNTYVLAFGRRHVLADTGESTTGVLDGSVEISPRATLLGGIEP